MFSIEKTTEFDKWFRRLRDLKAKAKILFRIQKSRLTSTLENANQLVMEFVSLKSTMLKDTEYILKYLTKKLSFSLLVEINQLRNRMLQGQKKY